MATCNNVTLILDSECVGESLAKINTNFSNLDGGLCEVGQQLQDLNDYVKSLNVIDSSTINLEFSSTPYALQANVIDNSLGTSKLGVDIPTTTKIFLTGAKVSSLIDTQITNPQTGELLIWNGSVWSNQKLEDKIGAKYLGSVGFPSELNDVLLTGLQDGQILKYDAGKNKWVNGVDDTEVVVRDGLYTDIFVNNVGKSWNIVPKSVGTIELAPNSVTNTKIEEAAITNEKIAPGTIQLDRCAFGIGEVNEGINIGSGTDIYAGKEGVKLKIKRLLGAGSCTINDDGSTITINVPTATAPSPATGENTGAGVGIYNETQSTPGALRFKRIVAGNGITISSNSNEITISSAPTVLGLSIIGINASGAPLTDAEVLARVQAVFNAGDYPPGTLCKVDVPVPVIAASGDIQVSVPFNLRYVWNGSSSFQLTQPAASPTGAANEYGASTTLNGTAAFIGTSRFGLDTRLLYTYSNQTGPWVLQTKV